MQCHDDFFADVIVTMYVQIFLIIILTHFREILVLESMSKYFDIIL